MVMTSGRNFVRAPARTSLLYGLESVAQVLPDGDAHWRLGVRTDVDPCGTANVATETCPATGAPATKTATGPMTTRTSNPFTVYSMPVCSTVGRTSEWEDIVKRGLLAGEWRAVEREFWTGDAGTIPHLAEDTAVTGIGFDANVVEQSAATVVTGGPVGVTYGLALLEEALGSCYGAEGVIHVPPAVLTVMKGAGLIIVDGNRLRTPNGHLIAAGAGYPGTSPAGGAATPGTRWIYATGAVWITRSDIDVTGTVGQAVDRAKNTLWLVAERTYLLGWDCCHLAMQVSISGNQTGSGG